MFIYTTDFMYRTTQINQFSYISTEFLHLYIYLFQYIYIINNNNHHGFFICIYIYIYICPPIFIFICIYQYIYLFFSHDITMSAQVILNAFSIGCHTLHTRPFHGLLFVMHTCVLINRINSIYLYLMFSIWLHTIGIRKIILACKQLNATIIITIVLYTI